jgi:phosphonate transport system substrate-binding protein
MRTADYMSGAPRVVCGRRSLLAAITLAATLRLPSAACAADGFSFGLTPLFLDNDIELLSMLKQYLAKQLDRSITLVKRRTYHEISAMLLSGQLDAAWICDDPYVQYQDKLALLAVPLYHQRPLYQSYVIVNENSKAQAFDDIRGTVHAFSDPDSTSGYLVTRWMLALRQIMPARFFRDSFFTYGHRNVLRAVGADLAQSGSIDGYVWDVMAEREPDLVRRTRVIVKSEWLGFPPIVAPMAIRDAPAVKKLAAALLDMPSDPLGREILKVLALDGFTEGTPGMYQSTMDKWLLVKAQA